VNPLEALDALGDAHPGAGTLLAAASGDWQAKIIAHDILEDEGMSTTGPFKVGQKYLICTVTLYYVGEVTEIGHGYLILKDASWVHWTGRLSLLLKHKDFAHPSLASRKPRTEFVGDVIIETHARIASYPGDWKLPKESIQ
jgi:hypothetical protein